MSRKGTIFDIKRFAVHDGPGIRTTVFLKGCPLACAWCHNPESRNREPEPARGLSPRLTHEFGGQAGIIGARVDALDVMEQVLLDRVFFEESGGGMTVSGGEPLLQPEFAATLLSLAREQGLRTAVDTSGAVPWESLEQVIPFTDLFLYDVKILDPADHERWVGAAIEPIRRNLERLVREGSTVRMRIPLIPDATDSDDNLEAAARLAQGLKGLQGVDLLPYNPAGEHKYSRLGIPLRTGHHASQSALALQRAATFFEKRAVPVSTGGSP